MRFSPRCDFSPATGKVTGLFHSHGAVPEAGLFLDGVRMPKPIYLVLGAILIVVIAGFLIWWRFGWAMTPSARKALQEILWVSCLMWGILLMISGATEGFPYTSIHIRDELAQDIVAFIGLFLAIFGTYYGFSLGKMKKRWLVHAPPLGPTGLKDQKR